MRGVLCSKVAANTITEMPVQTIAEELLEFMPRERVLSDPSELFVYESDGFTIAKSIPAAVVFPRNTDDVVRIMKLLAERDIQIVPRGSGTGLTGGCVAYENGVIVSTARMNKILKIDLENRVAHVEAGVRNTALSDAVAQLPFERTCECASALKFALITRPDAVPDQVRRDLAPIVGKYLQTT